MTDDATGGLDAEFEVLSRTPVSGGFSDASKVRLQVVLTENGSRVERSLLLKRTSRIERAALTAAAEVPGADAVPEVVVTGDGPDGPSVVTAFYEGEPAADDQTLPPNVIETLARVHAYYRSRPVPQRVPVIDGSWWRTKCEVAMRRLDDLGRPVARSLAARVKPFQDEPRMITALDEMPRTLIHGDVHRNNVIVDSDGRGHLIDWGGSFVGAAVLDLANLGGSNSAGYRTYLAAWQQLTGQRLDDDPGWHRSVLVATVWVNIKYLAFATKIFGDQQGESMMAAARAALREL